MQNYYGNSSYEVKEKEFQTTGLASAFMRQVFIIMGFGLAISGAAAWMVASHLMKGEWTGLLEGPMRWVVLLSPLAFVLVLSFGINRLSYGVASGIFALFSVAMGISLAPIFLIYTGASIATIFFLTAGLFGSMAVLATVLKVDLSKYSAYFMMALIGLILVGVVNWWLQSSMLDTIRCGFGVLLFCALTAYDTQKLLRMGVEANMQNEGVLKSALLGALALYLDFINLFLYLLRLFGNRK